MKRKKRILLLGDIVGMAAAVIVFVFPFLFMFVNSLKDRREANLLSMALPVKPLWSNYTDLFSYVPWPDMFFREGGDAPCLL